MAFDSTLGYPGEGPAAEGLLLTSLNANGLKGRRRARQLFLEARRNRVSILFIQEHNFDASSVKQLEKTAEHSGYASCISPKGNDTTRGGTAIFLNRDILGLGATSVPHQTYCNGRVTIVEVTICGERTKLACVYAPVSAVARLLFIQTLRREARRHRRRVAARRHRRRFKLETVVP